VSKLAVLDEQERLIGNDDTVDGGSDSTHEHGFLQSKQGGGVGRTEALEKESRALLVTDHMYQRAGDKHTARMVALEEVSQPRPATTAAP
jgi:hypothetical protein